MNIPYSAGGAMLLAHQGQKQLAAFLAAGIRHLAVTMAAWLGRRRFPSSPE